MIHGGEKDIVHMLVVVVVVAAAAAAAAAAVHRSFPDPRLEAVQSSSYLVAVAFLCN